MISRKKKNVTEYINVNNTYLELELEFLFVTVVLIRTGAKDGGGDAENPAAGNKKSINCLMNSKVLKSYGIMNDL